MAFLKGNVFTGRSSECNQCQTKSGLGIFALIGLKLPFPPQKLKISNSDEPLFWSIGFPSCLLGYCLLAQCVSTQLHQKKGFF